MRSQHSFYMEDELYRQLRIYAIEHGQTASDVLAEAVTKALAGTPPAWTDFQNETPPEIEAIKAEVDAKGFENVGEPVDEPPIAPSIAKVIKTSDEAKAAVSLLDREFHPVPKPTPTKRRTRR